MNNDRDFGPDRERRNKAFGWWLRTGRWPAADMPDEILLEDRVERAAAIRRWIRTGELPPKPVETKFNPWHDPANGQFTFAGTGSYFEGGGGGAGSDSSNGDRRPRATSAPKTPSVSDAVYRPDEAGARLELAQRRAPSRGGGSNSRAFQDPMTLEQVFPGLSGAVAGSILAPAGNFLDITGPSQELTGDLTRIYTNTLIEQIRAVDPSYRFESLGFPTTLQGQINQVNDLRFDRAVAIMRKQGELEPMQVETLRLMQAQTDAAYAKGLKLLQAGKLDVRLSKQEALGNYIDREVRGNLRERLRGYAINDAKDPVVRVNRRENSISEGSYRSPDARIGKVAFDVTLSEKTLATAQVRGFFNSDFKPTKVVIIRPILSRNSGSYIITKPENEK